MGFGFEDFDADQFVSAAGACRLSGMIDADLFLA
jgi:hypothetical protein